MFRANALSIKSPEFWQRGRGLALLVDPDAGKIDYLNELFQLPKSLHPDLILVGGSLLFEDRLTETLTLLRKNTDRPLVLFPGNAFQVSPLADGVLFLSLLSGRNPEFLIGQQLIATPRVKAANISVIPTGYLLVDGGTTTSVNYLTQTLPLPASKPELVATTALTGQFLGKQLIYLEAGSGARTPISGAVIQTTRSAIDIPIMVGGGIRTPEAARQAWESGANWVVVGSAIEKKPLLWKELRG